ncbi:MAG: hypothetical protein R3F42_10020 [Pseudomonadota bacterium]
MKNNYFVLVLLGCLLTASSLLPSAASAAEAAPAYPADAGGQDTANAFWTIPSFSRPWDRPAPTPHWTIPSVSKRWGIPARSGHWTIPRTADDMR